MLEHHLPAEVLHKVKTCPNEFKIFSEKSRMCSTITKDASNGERANNRCDIRCNNPDITGRSSSSRRGHVNTRRWERSSFRSKSRHRGNQGCVSLDRP